jgi:diaminopimelate decarboxylase
MTEPTLPDSRFRVSGAKAEELAAAFGTPLYVIDEGHFRAKIRRYQSAFRAVYPRTELAFASKANNTLAILKIAHQEGCRIDVASEGEFRAALRAGIPASDCHLHGNNKKPAEIEFAIESGIGQIVLDHFSEIELVARFLHVGRDSTELLLRLAPGVDPQTHAKISTGQADTKFGFNIADGSAERAANRCQELGLPLVGIHCHVGSQLLDPNAQRAGGEHLAGFLLSMKQSGRRFKTLNVGGGLGVHYVDGDHPMPVEDYCRLIVDSITSVLGDTSDLVLAQEPGRSLIAESGVTLYEVGVIKTVPVTENTQRTYVAVDGGLYENSRPALYGARYAVESFRHGNVHPVTVCGRHCETDTLFPDVLLATDLEEGDLLQVLTTGAYNSSMSNNYNRFPRPATVLLREDGRVDLIQHRESYEAMFERESIPEDL